MAEEPKFILKSETDTPGTDTLCDTHSRNCHTDTLLGGAAVVSTTWGLNNKNKKAVKVSVAIRRLFSNTRVGCRDAAGDSGSVPSTHVAAYSCPGL